LEDVDVDGRIILKWILENWDGEVWTGSIWLRIEQIAGSFDCCDELSGSIKCRKFID
jgi:hypothetical protein